MTLYQAKGLEFPSFVPQLLRTSGPRRPSSERPLPRELLGGRAAGRHPHRGGAPAPLRRPDPRARAARAHHPSRAAGADGAVALHRGHRARRRARARPSWTARPRSPPVADGAAVTAVRPRDARRHRANDAWHTGSEPRAPRLLEGIDPTHPESSAARRALARVRRRLGEAVRHGRGCRARRRSTR